MDWVIEYFAPLAGAVAAGGLIGFEREYRGRAAGVRTHILLCLASALLMLAAVHQVRWMGAPRTTSSASIRCAWRMAS